MTGNRAYTLVEILVVVAIVAVLFGIVYAAFGGAREKARESVCISNLHQLGTALHMYLQDYEANDNPKLMAQIPFDPNTTLRPYGGDRSKYQCLDEVPQGPFHTHVNYLWGIVRDPAPSGAPSTEWLYRQCGDQMVIWSDVNHNFPDPNLPPSARQFWILNRLDGSVTTGYYNTSVNLNWINPCFQK